MKSDYYITGITGYLGRNLVRALLDDPDTNMIYGIARRWADVERVGQESDRVHILTGDIRNPHDVRKFMELGKYQVRRSYLIHTAAYKHVPLAQSNVEECVSVNIDGTANVVRLAHQNGLFQSMVMISTDKAVTPINVYGQSKAIAEQLVFSYGGKSNMKSIVCRFGNVFGSTGSVVQKWGEQLSRPKPKFTVFSEDMTRYWFKIDDAVEYILWSLRNVPHDALAVPVLKSSTIKSLLTAFVQISKAMGLSPQAEFLSARAGEKVHESMVAEHELLRGRSSVFNIRDGLSFIVVQPDALGPRDERPALEEVKPVLSSDFAERYSVADLVKMVAEYMRSNL